MGVKDIEMWDSLYSWKKNQASGGVDECTNDDKI